MSIAGLEGLLIGVLLGLFVRPILDSYLAWKHMQASRREFPLLDPFVEEEESDLWLT